ncbi:MAG: YcxB family protein [Planctomycetaceae bacterium]|nr:YcxB family protein [Planctomycetaceae bacterium]
MTLTYEFGREDLLHWYRHFHRSSPGVRSQRSRFIVSWSLSFFGLAILVSVPALASESWPFVIPALMLATGFSIATPKWFDLRIEQALQALVADPRLEGSFGPVQLVLTDEGMREIMPATNSLVQWASITEVIADADYIFVRLTTGQAAVISRQSYSGPVLFDEIPKVIDEFRQRHAA